MTTLHVTPADDLQSALGNLQPGDVLSLAPGTYRSPLKPPPGLWNIKLRAQVDGTVLIDGQGDHSPIELYQNPGCDIEGFNACNAGPQNGFSSVVQIHGESHGSTVKRVCAWDAGPVNGEVFGVHDSEDCLFKDCAGWGVARKIFTNSQGGNNASFRRCWARWEGYGGVGPKMAYSIAYNSYGCYLENCIGTWDAVRQGPTIPDQPYSILTAERQDADDQDCKASIGGCLFYLPSDARLPPDYGTVFASKSQGVTIRNTLFASLGPRNAATLYGYNGWRANSIVVAGDRNYMASVLDSHGGALMVPLIGGKTGSVTPAWPANIGGICRDGTVVWQRREAKLSLDYCTVVGPSAISGLWDQTACRIVSKPGGYMLEPDEQGNGADLRNLFPWPMEQRIQEAMKQSNNPKPVSVTAEALSILVG